MVRRLRVGEEGVERVDEVVQERGVVVDGGLVLAEERVPAPRREPEGAKRLHGQEREDAQQELRGQGVERGHGRGAQGSLCGQQQNARASVRVHCQKESGV